MIASFGLHAAVLATQFLAMDPPPGVGEVAAEPVVPIAVTIISEPTAPKPTELVATEPARTEPVPAPIAEPPAEAVPTQLSDPDPVADLVPPAVPDTAPDEAVEIAADPPTEPARLAETEPETMSAPPTFAGVSPPRKPAVPDRPRPRSRAVAKTEQTIAVSPSIPSAPARKPAGIATVNAVQEQGRDLSPSRTVTTGGAELGHIFTAPYYLDHPEPPYPAAELRRRREGVVLLRVSVAADGHVTNIVLKRSSGVSAFDRAALKAVRQWRFYPAMVGGIPTPGVADVPVRFALRR